MLQKWKLTTQLRNKSLPATVREYLRSYPALTEPLGYTLLEADFDNLYPEKEHLFYLTWPKLYRIVLKIREKG